MLNKSIHLCKFFSEKVIKKQERRRLLGEKDATTTLECPNQRSSTLPRIGSDKRLNLVVLWTFRFYLFIFYLLTLICIAMNI